MSLRPTAPQEWRDLRDMLKQAPRPHLMNLRKPVIVTESDLQTSTSPTVRFFDVSDRTQIRITGKDRAAFLHNFTSNHIKKLTPGKGCETFVTNIKGKVVAHLFVFATADSLWLDGTPGQEPAILSHLGKYVLIDDVQLISQKGLFGELYVTGAIAAQLLQLDAPMSIGDHVVRGEGSEAFSVRRVDLFDEPGFLMSIPIGKVDQVKAGFLMLGIPEGSQADFEAARIAAGYPAYGTDITEDQLAQEVARTTQCISFDKGCYLGQETIARLDSLGHTNRELRGLSFATTSIPASGTPIFDATGQAEVGVLTSATLTSGDDANSSQNVAALGMLKRVAMTPGTVVTLNLNGEIIQGQVK